MRKFTFLSAVLAVWCIAGCEKKDENVFLMAGETTPPPNDPAHYKGQSCDTCHEDWNIVQLHDASSPLYDSDCMKCHGDMTDETTLDATVMGVHPKKCPQVFLAAGVTTYTNAVCVYCHKSVDILGSSAGNLLKQVEVAECRACHTAAGPGKVLYK